MKERFTLVTCDSTYWAVVELNNNPICKAQPIRFFGAQETSNSFVISSRWIGKNSHKIWLHRAQGNIWLWFPPEPSTKEEQTGHFDDVCCCFNGREIDRWLNRYAGPLVTRLTLWIRFETI